MPELPEVETIRRGLSDKIIGKKIIGIDILNVNSFCGDTKKVIGFEIIDIVRRAKVIQIKLSNDFNLLFHLKMTGQLIHQNHESRSMNYGIDFVGGHPDHEWHRKQPGEHTRIIFTFDDKNKLFFNDMRKFGWCKVLTDLEVEEIFAKSYGLEPIRLANARSGQTVACEANPNFTVEYLLEKAKRIPNRNAKQFLMDQTICAGMGNIYTDEALFDSEISPLRKIRDIKISEWKRLIESMQKVLEMGIKYGGTTDSDYVNVDGKKGGMQDYLKVYHKQGTTCPNSCGGKIEQIRIGGRGTHFCGNCQK